jgi:predicted restriction endonuclease
MVFDWFIGDKEPERRKISKDEWSAKKKILGNRCVICKRTEKAVGVLEKAHIKAHSKGGNEYLPMCRNCHYKYDKGLFSSYELRKIGLDMKSYRRLITRKRPKYSYKEDDSWLF